MLLTSCLTFLKKTVEMHLKVVHRLVKKSEKFARFFTKVATFVLFDLNRLHVVS